MLYNFKSAWINITRRCNLRCSYCFINRFETEDSRSGDMTKEVLDATIKFFIDKNEEGVALSFFGGEPLLRFDLMKYAMDKYSTMLFMVSTNATLITEEIVDYFISKKNFIEVILSIDGEPTTERLNRGGSVDEDLVRKVFAKCHRHRARMTVIDPDRALQDIKYLYGLGARKIQVNIPHNVKLQDLYFKKMKVVQEAVRLSPELSKAVSISKEPLGPMCGSGLKHCNPGDQYVTVDIDGSIYPCDIFRLKNEFRLGSIKDGIDDVLLSKFTDYINNEKKEIVSLCIAEQIYDREIALHNGRLRDQE